MDQYPVRKTDEEWRSELTEMQYYVLRQAGTERPFAGEYTDNEASGVYHCAGCDHALFSAEQKYHSGCGWPSFWSELGSASIERRMDYSHNMVRVELRCSQCGGHLGHIFNDGPPPTNVRYCINSVALRFSPLV